MNAQALDNSSKNKWQMPKSNNNLNLTKQSKLNRIRSQVIIIKRANPLLKIILLIKQSDWEEARIKIIPLKL